MEIINLKEKIYEILRSPVAIYDAESIISCCKFAWPWGIYPYKGLMNPVSWGISGELGDAIKKGEMFSSVVRENGQIVAHAALVKNKLGLWELGRVFTNNPGKGYGVQVVDSAIKLSEEINAEFVYMGRSYNRTPMMGVASKVAEVNGMDIAVVGISPHLYDEVGSDGNSYKWGEVDSLIIKKGKKLSIRLPNNAPAKVKRLIEIISNNNPNIDMVENHDPIDKVNDGIEIDNNIELIDINKTSQQEALIKLGHIPVGVLPVKGSWYVKFFNGEVPQVRLERMSIVKPGISPVYCSDEREFRIINSILNK